jgi:YD repeat-containing protein
MPARRSLEPASATTALTELSQVTLPDSTSRESTHDLFGAVHYDAQKNEQHVTQRFRRPRGEDRRTALPQPWDPGSSLTSSVVYGPFGHIKTATDPAATRPRCSTTIAVAATRPSTRIEEQRRSLQRARRIEAQTATDLVSYMRDDLGRVTHITDAEGVSTLTWDVSANGIGKLSAAMSVDGTAVDYTYDSVGRVHDATWTLADASAPLVVSREYNDLGQLKTVEYPDVAGSGDEIGYIITRTATSSTCSTCRRRLRRRCCGR